MRVVVEEMMHLLNRLTMYVYIFFHTGGGAISQQQISQKTALHITYMCAGNQFLEWLDYTEWC